MPYEMPWNRHLLYSSLWLVSTKFGEIECLSSLYYWPPVNRPALSSLSDEQLCASLQRTYARVEGKQMGPARLLKSGPNCQAKTLNNRLAVAATGSQREKYVSVFMAAAEAGLCRSTDPTVLAFKARHWRWTYQFNFADGTVANKDLACVS
jgi:hypothetical protein